MTFHMKQAVALGVLAGLAPVLLSACGTSAAVSAPKASPTATPPNPKIQPTKASAPGATSPLALLALGARTQTAQPYHVDATITDTLGNVDVHMTVAVDPLNKETETTDHMTMSGISGANPVTVVGQSISIGSQAWGESTPPGGGWHESTVPPAKLFPLSELLPYVVNVHAVPGKLIHGHATQGVSATLNKKGVRLLESFAAGKSVSAAQQIITAMVFTLWVGPDYHPREVDLTEHCVQEGHAYQVFERLTYDHWGQAIHLVPPT